MAVAAHTLMKAAVLAIAATSRVRASAVGCAAPLGHDRKVYSALGAAGAALQDPSAVAFHPTTHELYVTDHATHSLAAFNLTGPTPTARYLRDRARYHYMAAASSLSFDPLGQFATCQESLNNYEGKMLPNFFMGPTLYDSRLSLVNSKQEPCEAGDTCFLIHIDMLHEAPLCMGIAHDNGASVVRGGRTYRNVYWTYDGGSAQLVRFDFESDHGPGSMDHSLASVRRYTGLLLTRVAGVPSHMAVDDASRTLYVTDTGADRVVAVEMDTGYWGYDAKPIFPVYSSPAATFNYSVWHGISYSVLGAVPRPSGLALTADTLYVASHSTAAIYAFDRATGRLAQLAPLPGLTALAGIALDPTGDLVVVDAGHKSVSRVYVTSACATVGVGAGACTNGVKDGDESDVDCGGASCARCALAAACGADNDCASGTCSSGACAPSARTIQNSQFLWNYLDSDFYANSFAHHLIHGGMGGASYLNPYPIMEQGFCAQVGTVRRNFSLVNGTAEVIGEPVVLSEPDCSLIDFDSLLLGGCWCHVCLPENPCGSGTCVNYRSQGYTCDCSGTNRTGDHCEIDADGHKVDFPWFSLPLPEPPAEPVHEDQSRTTFKAVPLAIGCAVAAWAGVMVVLAFAWKRRRVQEEGKKMPGVRAAAEEVSATWSGVVISSKQPELASAPPSPPGEMEFVGPIGRKVAWCEDA